MTLLWTVLILGQLSLILGHGGPSENPPPNSNDPNPTPGQNPPPADDKNLPKKVVLPKPRNWKVLQEELVKLCPDGSAKTLRYCPLIHAAKDFLAGCPASLKQVQAAIKEEDQLVMQKYLRSLGSALAHFDPDKKKDKDGKEIEEPQKDKKKKNKEEEEKEEWGKSMAPYGKALLAKFKDFKAEDDELARLVIEIIIKLIERMQEKKLSKSPVEFLIPLERILDRVLMLQNSKRLATPLEEERVKQLQGMLDKVEECRQLYQRNFFVVIMSLILLGVMLMVVGAYVVKTSKGKKASATKNVVLPMH